MLSKQERIEKHLAKIEAYEGYARNAETRSAQRLGTAKNLGDMIPMGQPILVGHHSERGHLAHVNRMDANMRKGIEESEKAEYWRGKIAWHEAQVRKLNGLELNGLELNAQQKREVWEEKFRSAYKVGDVVKCFLRNHIDGGRCEIVKMNVKTARIRFADGVEWTQNLSLLHPADAK